MKVWFLALALIAPSAAIAQDDGGLEVGTRAPAVSAMNLKGQTVNLDAIGKKPVLIEFWATWCEVCAALEPTVRSAYRTYGTRVQFYVVAVNLNESLAKVSKHVSDNRLPYPVLYDGSGKASRLYEAPATSYVVVIGTDGKVAYSGVGSSQKLAEILARVR